MISHRVLLVAGLALSSAVAPAFAAKLDGTWSMLATTTNGHCGLIAVGLNIKGNRISSTSGAYAFNPIKLDGQISKSGKVTLRAITGPRIARGTGKFTNAEGKGTWRGDGPSGVCTGVWTATRV